MRPWERALAREPMCAFIEAVVDGYSPIDKYVCKFARIAAVMRSEPWWTDLSWCTEPGAHRGEVTYAARSESVWSMSDNVSGEINV